jgi:hypothetical protein
VTDESETETKGSKKSRTIERRWAVELMTKLKKTKQIIDEAKELK